MKAKSLYILIFICIVTLTVTAQDAIEPQPLNSDNVGQFQSVYQLDFAEIALPDSDIVNIGWFTYTPTQNSFLLLDNAQSLLSVTSDYEITSIISSVNLVDAVSFGEGFYAILITTEDGFSILYDNLQAEQHTSHRIDIATSAIPSAIWITCPDNSELNGNGCYAGVEAILDSETLVYLMPPADLSLDSTHVSVTDNELAQIPYAPNADDEAVVRIGRIPLPYVVTSSLGGIVKLWNIETGEILHEVDNYTGEPSVFGNINADATHLVWRDNFNQTLYLLNFETGENREVAPLNGDYAQWYFLSNDASVIIAVNLGSQPNVIAWDTATGERTDLGDYRECERPQPDKVDFTPDGSTLIIGCDTGLDIWHVTESE